MTVIAVAAHPGEFPSNSLDDISHTVPGIPKESGVYVIPSLIWYDEGCAAGIGDEVLRSGREQHISTARWMRRYLFDNSPVQVPAGNSRRVRCGDAADEFLTNVLSRAVKQYPGGADLVFALPKDAPADYPAWLERISRAANARSCSWVNEYLAAARGYGISIQAGELFLVISFAETELTATIVFMAEPGEERGGRESMRTRAQASFPTGCQGVDSWIVQDLLARFWIPESDPRAERLRPQLCREARRVRELSPCGEQISIAVTDPAGARTYTTSYGLEELTRVLIDHNVIESVRDVVSRALSSMQARGEEPRIGAILLIGPGCALPEVAESVRDRFPGIPVHAGHEMDAIARGALVFAKPARAPDRITNSYALRYWDPAAEEHHYRFIVHSGARFPSEGQVARITISAAYDGQTHLGIPLFEIAGDRGRECAIELVSDSTGGFRLAGPAEELRDKVQALPVNERDLTLLVAEPPAKKGDPRFECTFVIDRERYLCLSARDLATGTLVKLNRQIYQLT